MENPHGDMSAAVQSATVESAGESVETVVTQMSMSKTEAQTEGREMSETEHNLKARHHDKSRLGGSLVSDSRSEGVKRRISAGTEWCLAQLDPHPPSYRELAL